MPSVTPRLPVAGSTTLGASRVKRIPRRCMHAPSDDVESPVQGTIPFLGRGIEVGQYAEVCTSYVLPN